VCNVCVGSRMKLYSLTVMYKGLDGRVKKLCSASDLASFGYFQRSRLAKNLVNFPFSFRNCTSNLAAHWLRSSAGSSAICAFSVTIYKPIKLCQTDLVFGL